MKTYRLSLLSPLYYRTGRDSGASGTTYTAPWIGDLALLYAVNNSLGLTHIKFGYTSLRPDYSGIDRVGIALSVATPEVDVSYTRTYDIATSFLSEGYPQTKLIRDSGRAPMRNWLKRRGIEAGNVFYFSAFFKNSEVSLPENFTLRIGNTREALALCEEVAPQKEEKLTLNIFTMGLFLGKERTSEMLKNLEGENDVLQIERPVPQYVLVRNVSVESALSFLSPYK